MAQLSAGRDAKLSRQTGVYFQNRRHR
ncbi:MAG: hypothetical protein ACJAVS_002817, partial [Paracoccaceae bacterium]